jgi:aryl-alcohol dehydrogenase-like predicted oxidoreductase
VKRNRLGRSDLWVSELGLGCMSLPKDDLQAIQILHQAMDETINFFDTADLYGQGDNERLLGEACKGRRANVIIATKVGNKWHPGKTGWTWAPSKDYIHQAVRDSLRRLQTDYIDLYQLHGGTLEDPFDEIIETFEELRQLGYIRYYGISSIRPNVIRKYVERSNIVSVMMQYSALDRRPEESILAYLLEQKVKVLARGPVAHGILSDRQFANSKGERDGYLEYSPADLRDILGQLRMIAGNERAMSQLALQYVMKNPAVASTVAGASRVEQLHENVRASELYAVTDDELTQIRSITKPLQYREHR